MRKKFGRLKNINKTNTSKLENSPGVYSIYSKTSRLLKIGRAKRNRPAERILENANEIVQAKKFGFISTKTVQEAIRLETKLIRNRKPPLNIEKKGK